MIGLDLEPRYRNGRPGRNGPAALLSVATRVTGQRLLTLFHPHSVRHRFNPRRLCLLLPLMLLMGPIGCSSDSTSGQIGTTDNSGGNVNATPAVHLPPCQSQGGNVCSFVSIQDPAALAQQYLPLGLDEIPYVVGHAYFYVFLFQQVTPSSVAIRWYHPLSKQIAGVPTMALRWRGCKPPQCSAFIGKITWPVKRPVPQGTLGSWYAQLLLQGNTLVFSNFRVVSAPAASTSR